MFVYIHYQMRINCWSIVSIAWCSISWLMTSLDTNCCSMVWLLTSVIWFCLDAWCSTLDAWLMVMASGSWFMLHRQRATARPRGQGRGAWASIWGTSWPQGQASPPWPWVWDIKHASSIKHQKQYQMRSKVKLVIEPCSMNHQACIKPDQASTVKL